LHSLDSPDQALGEFDTRRVDKLQKRARKLIEEIEELKRVPIVRELQDQGYFGSCDLLRSRIGGQWPQFSMCTHCGKPLAVSAPFDGLLRLLEIAKGILGNPKKPKHPDYDTDLAGLYGVIHNYSNHRYDALVADILRDALDRPQISEDSLRN